MRNVAGLTLEETGAFALIVKIKSCASIARYSMMTATSQA